MLNNAQKLYFSQQTNSLESFNKRVFKMKGIYDSFFMKLFQSVMVILNLRVKIQGNCIILIQLTQINNNSPMSKRTIWKQEEDSLLKKLVDDNGEDDWNLISQQFNKLQKKFKRNPIQCKERWTKNLSSKIKKTKWSKDQKEKLFKIFLSSQNKWVDISKNFKNRTDRDIKNNLYNSLRKGIRRLCKIVKIDDGTSKVRDIKSKALLKTIMTLDYQIRNQHLGFDFFSLIFQISLGNKKQKQITEKEGYVQILKEKIQKLFNKPQTSSQLSSENYQANNIQRRTGSLGNLNAQGNQTIGHFVNQLDSKSESEHQEQNNLQEPIIPIIDLRIQSISKFIRWPSK